MRVDPQDLTLQLASAPSVSLTPSQRALVDLIAQGWLAPLEGFMSRAERDTVEHTGRLPNRPPGTSTAQAAGAAADAAFPCAVTLDVPRAALPDALPQGSWLALRDADGTLLGGLHVAEIETVEDTPGGARAAGAGERVSVGGRLAVARLPAHADFPELRLAPEPLARDWPALGPAAPGRAPVIAYQPRQFLHRGLEEALQAAHARLGASILLQVLVPHAGELPLAHFSRIKAIRASAAAMTPPDASDATGGGREGPTVRVLDVPGDMNPDAARLRTWLAARAGATHLAVAPDEVPFEPWDPRLAAELGLDLVALKCDARFDVQALELALHREGSLPAWAVRPDVARALAHAWRPRAARGLTIFLTGLSGAGKSTIAHYLRAQIMERAGREVTLLDGDLVRRHLSSELGFSREHRDLNIRRIGAVAAEITRHHGIAICAPIAPYDATRREVRQMIEPVGGFVLVHVATPVEVCESRDTKGLYARARAGGLPQFTGVSDPYEAPADAEVVIDAARLQPRESAEAILRFLDREGFLTLETTL